MYNNLLGLDLNKDTQDKIASKVLLLCTLFRLLYQLCKGIIPHERRETLHFISLNLCDWSMSLSFLSKFKVQINAFNLKDLKKNSQIPRLRGP